MNKSDYLQFCRYYKGEKNPPRDTSYTFWEYEQKYVDWLLSDDICLDNMLNEYISKGLENYAMRDGTPIALKALLYNRYSYWTQGDTDGFKKWYQREYLKAG